MADSTKPMAPNKGMPLIKGGIWAMTKIDDPIDRAAMITAKTKRLTDLLVAS